MKIHVQLLLGISFCLFIIGCTVSDTSHSDFRIEVLFDHSVMMVDFLTPGELSYIGFNSEPFLQKSVFGSYSQSEKLLILQSAFNISVLDEPKHIQIEILEQKMNEMMDDLIELNLQNRE